MTDKWWLEKCLPILLTKRIARRFSRH